MIEDPLSGFSSVVHYRGHGDSKPEIKVDPTSMETTSSRGDLSLPARAGDFARAVRVVVVDQVPHDAPAVRRVALRELSRGARVRARAPAPVCRLCFRPSARNHAARARLRGDRLREEERLGGDGGGGSQSCLAKIRWSR